LFEVGELIFYGNTGVCRVHELVKRSMAGAERIYYILKPLYQECTISTPADNVKVFMRPIISKQEAQDLIDTIPSIKAQSYHSPVLRELTEHYEQAIKTFNCADLLEMTMSIYIKKTEFEQQNRKFGAIDEKFMKRAEKLLFGELAAALEIPREQVQEYIEERLKKQPI